MTYKKPVKQLDDLSMFDLAVVVACETGVPINFVGAPGTSKTARLTWIVSKLPNTKLASVLIGSSLDPTEVRGFPRNDMSYSMTLDSGETVQGRMEYSLPDWALECFDLQKRGIKPVLFFDEINTAPPAVQAALLRPLNEGYVGRYPLGNTVRIAASNDSNQSDGFRMSQALNNRFCRLPLIPTVQDWVDWANGEDDFDIEYQPLDKETQRELLVQYATQASMGHITLYESENEAIPRKPFTSRRSLTYAAKIAAFLLSNNVPVEKYRAFAKGLLTDEVGNSAVNTTANTYTTLIRYNPTQHITVDTSEKADAVYNAIMRVIDEHKTSKVKFSNDEMLAIISNMNSCTQYIHNPNFKADKVSQGLREVNPSEGYSVDADVNIESKDTLVEKGIKGLAINIDELDIWGNADGLDDEDIDIDFSKVEPLN